MSWHPDVTDIQALIDGELDAQARRGVEAHLQGCATCGATAARLREISGALHAIPRTEAPADLHERILCTVASAPRVVEPACAECAEMASAYVDGELIGADRNAFEAHVFACPKCYATLKHTERAAELLRAIPRRRVPEELFERITAAVAAGMPPPCASPGAESPRWEPGSPPLQRSWSHFYCPMRTCSMGR